MALKEIQDQVDEWFKEADWEYWTPFEILATLMEETGELAREVNHEFGSKNRKPTEDHKDMADEMGDIIFDVVCLANSLDINLDEAFQRCMKKYDERDRHRHK